MRAAGRCSSGELGRVGGIWVCRLLMRISPGWGSILGARLRLARATSQQGSVLPPGFGLGSCQHHSSSGLCTSARWLWVGCPAFGCPAFGCPALKLLKSVLIRRTHCPCHAALQARRVGARGAAAAQRPPLLWAVTRPTRQPVGAAQFCSVAAASAAVRLSRVHPAILQLAPATDQC